MLAHARVRAPKAEFVKQDIADWAPEDRPDLIFANAALQFLPDHDRLFPRLMSYLAPGGALAAQMPNTARESSHALMRMVAAEGPWSSRLVPIAKTQPLIAGYEDYYDWLRPQASQVDIWTTTYVHPLEGPQSIADWFAGSTLQPFLERLDDDERCEFLARYRNGLKEAYPVQPDGRTLFAYPRLFIVAVKAVTIRRAQPPSSASNFILAVKACFTTVTETSTFEHRINPSDGPRGASLPLRPMRFR